MKIVRQTTQPETEIVIPPAPVLEPTMEDYERSPPSPPPGSPPPHLRDYSMDYELDHYPPNYPLALIVGTNDPVTGEKQCSRSAILNAYIKAYHQS